MRYMRFSTTIASIVLVVGAPHRTCAQDAPAQVGVEGRWEAQLGGSGLRLLLELTPTRDSPFFGSFPSPEGRAGTRNVWPHPWELMRGPGTWERRTNELPSDGLRSAR
jgi:hypothetical protein